MTWLAVLDSSPWCCMILVLSSVCWPADLSDVTASVLMVVVVTHCLVDAFSGLSCSLDYLISTVEIVEVHHCIHDAWWYLLLAYWCLCKLMHQGKWSLPWAFSYKPWGRWFHAHSQMINWEKQPWFESRFVWFQNPSLGVLVILSLFKQKDFLFIVRFPRPHTWWQIYFVLFYLLLF